MECLICKKSFSPRNTRHLTCSVVCSQKLMYYRKREKAGSKMKMVECIICGKSFETNRRTLTCGRECNLKKNQNIRKALRDKKRAENPKISICAVCGDTFEVNYRDRVYCPNPECKAIGYTSMSERKKLKGGEELPIDMSGFGFGMKPCPRCGKPTIARKFCSECREKRIWGARVDDNYIYA